MNSWEHARQEYIKGLSKEDQKLFSSATLETVLAETIRADDAHRKSNKARAISQKLQPLLSAIDSYGKALDILSNSGDIICPLWGSLRILLRIGQEFSNYFENLVEMLETIGDLLPRFGAYSTLFAKHVPLQQALSSLYLQIITFCSDAKNFFSQRTARLIGKVVWSSFEQEFGGTLDKFRRYARLVQDEAELAHMVESMREREEACRERKKTEEERRSAEQSRGYVRMIKDTSDNRENREIMTTIKKWLQVRLCDEEHQRLQENRLPGTCEWILESKELQRWEVEAQFQVLWVYGLPGCGKSYVSSKLLDYLTAKQTPIVFFVFSNSDNERNTSTSSVRSWAFQLLEMFPESRGLAERRRSGNEHRSATVREAIDLLLALLGDIPPCVLAVDGLDEISDRLDLLRLVQRIPRQHKVLIVSREQMDIKNVLSQRKACLVTIKIEPDCIQSDIDAYISQRLDDEFAIYEDISLTTRIRERLSQSHGMFLWVRLMFDHLLLQTTIEELLDALEELPSGLDDTYDVILTNINKLPKARQLLANKILLWVTTVKRPLSVTELRTSLAIRPGDEFFDEKKLILNAQSTLLLLCGPLIEVLEPGNIVRTVHFTVDQYFTRYLEESHILQEIQAPTLNTLAGKFTQLATKGQAQEYRVPELFECADSFAAAVCLTYLSFPAIGDLPPPNNCDEATDVVSPRSPSMAFLSYASLYWHEHVKLTSDEKISCGGLLRRFLNPGRKNMEVWWRVYWFSGADSYQSVVCPSKFSPLHIAGYFGLDSVIKHMEVGPEEEEKALDSNGRTALWWAASMGHAESVAGLIERGIDLDAADKFSMTPAHRAAANGYASVFRHLAKPRPSEFDEQGHVVQPKTLVDNDGWSPLHWAAARGDVEIIGMILRRASAPCERTKEYGDCAGVASSGQTPIMLAALNGHAKAVWEIGYHHSSKWINCMQDHNGNTALHLAAQHGHANVVGELLDCGVDLLITDNNGKTAADKARLMGYDAIGTLLSLRQHNYSLDIDGLAANSNRTQIIGRHFQEYGLSSSPFLGKGSKPSFNNSRDAFDSSAIDSCITGHRTIMALLIGKSREWRVRDQENRTMLHHACIAGHDEIARDLLRVAELINRAAEDDDSPWEASELEENKKNDYSSTEDFVNFQDNRGWTALHYAAACGYVGLVRTLLSSNASVEVRDNDGRTPFESAASQGNQGVMEFMAKVESPITDDMALEFNWTPVHCAARRGDLPYIENAILQKSVDLLAPGRFGHAPIHIAVEMGHPDIVDALARAIPLTSNEVYALSRTASESQSSGLGMVELCLGYLQIRQDDACSEKGRDDAQFLLFSATEQGNEAVVKKLCEAGARLDVLHPQWRETVLHIAARKGNTALVELFLSNGADISGGNSRKQSPFGHAASNGCVDMISCFLKYGADINSQNEDGETPIYCAIQYYYRKNFNRGFKAIKLLLDHGADVEIKDSKYHTTPVWRAQHYRYIHAISGNTKDVSDATAVLELLQSYRPDLVRPFLADGSTPLHAAAKQGDCEAIKKILDSGGIPVDDYEIGEGSTWKPPIYYAADNGFPEAVNLLLEYGADPAPANCGNTIAQVLSDALIWKERNIAKD